MNVVVVRASVVALYESPASVAGARLPVAEVPKATNVVVSPAASAKVTVPALPVTDVWSPVLVPETVVVPVTASVGVELPENVIPFTVVGVIAAREMVRAGVAPPEDVPETPLAVATETAVTVPVAADDQLVTPAPSVVRTLVLDPFADGSWKTIPAPAVGLTLMIPVPEVDPVKVT
jgi:hypothetical protein